MSETLLVCYMEFSAVGHVIELLRHALGYHAADPSRRIGVLLPANSPRELTDLCPFVDAVYPVSPMLDDLPDSLAQVPRDWDWIVDNPRRYDPTHVAAWDGLDRFFETTERVLRARRGRAVIGVEPPSYRPHQQLRLQIPDTDRQAAHNLLADAEVRIAVMPTGSGPRAHYPSTASWELVLRGLTERFPGARICLLGKLRADDRTCSTLGADELARLLAAFPDAVDGFDRPIVQQLALVEACDLFISPHTGFGMAALAVATPWLTISGGSWGENFFNGVPFYSRLPDPERFGAYTPYNPPPLLANDEDGEGPRTPSMSRARIIHDLNQLLEAATLLIEPVLRTSRPSSSTSVACFASSTAPRSGRSRTSTATTCSALLPLRPKLGRGLGRAQSARDVLLRRARLRMMRHAPQSDEASHGERGPWRRPLLHACPASAGNRGRRGPEVWR